jgi:ribonuclease III
MDSCKMALTEVWKYLRCVFMPGQKSICPDIHVLTERLGYTFKDRDVLYQAIKHRSYLTYSGEKRLESNERLELLGDAVLGLVVTDFLFLRYKNAEEGKLTNLKSLLVNRKILSEISRDFDLGKFILLNDSEEKSGGRNRESILADALEALIGAIYLDGGLDSAKVFIYKHITSRLGQLMEQERLKNFKSMLQEHCQGSNLTGPVYKVERESGPDHEKVFTVSVFVSGQKIGTGSANSKKKAEQIAAHETLAILKVI